MNTKFAVDYSSLPMPTVDATSEMPSKPGLQPALAFMTALQLLPPMLPEQTCSVPRMCTSGVTTHILMCLGPGHMSCHVLSIYAW